MDLVGLGQTRIGRSVSREQELFKNAMRLFLFIEEPVGLLPSFCRVLSQEFMDAGLERRDPLQTLQGGFEELAYRQSRVIETKGLDSGLRNLKPSLKHARSDLRPRFDARDLCEKYKDVVWAKNVHLDRVCISEIGPENVYEDEEVLGVRYNDIASVPLPGVTWEPRQFEYLRLPHRSGSQRRYRA